MSIKLQDISTSTNLDLTDKVLVSDGTSEHLVTVETFLGRMSTLFQGIRKKTQEGDPTISLANDGWMYKIPLTTDGVEVPNGDSGMSIVDGGIKVTATGSYKVTGDIYLSANGSNANGVYIFYGSSFTDGAPADTGATELCGVYGSAIKASMKQVAGIVTNVPANTIFYLVGRSEATASTAGHSWLLVERLA